MKKLLFLCATLFATLAAFSQAASTAPTIFQMNLTWAADTAINANFAISGDFPLTVNFVVSKESGAQEKLLDTSFTFSTEGYKQVYLRNIGIQDKDYRLLVAIADTNGSYNVYGYSITNSPFIAAPTGITDVDQKSISLFPNPCSNNLKITVEEDMDVKLLDITGRAVLAKALHTGSNSIATDNIPSGIYLATLTDSKGRVTTQRILKE